MFSGGAGSADTAGGEAVVAVPNRGSTTRPARRASMDVDTEPTVFHPQISRNAHVAPVTAASGRAGTAKARPAPYLAPIRSVGGVASLRKLVVPLATTRGAEPGGGSWLARYQRALVAVDLLTASLAVGLAFLLRFGKQTTHSGAYNLLLCLLIPLGWVTVVAANRAYEGRFVGVGSQEFSRMFHAFLHVSAIIAMASFAARVDLSRALVLAALPLCLAFGLAGRYGARKWLHAQRARGKALNSVLVVGDANAIVEFTELVRRDRHAGLSVVGACVPSEAVVDPELHDALDTIEVPVLGDVDSVVRAVQACGADTVAVVTSGLVGPEKLRWISWQLEGSSTSLVVSPGLIEVAGPRLHIQPVAGLPLLHVEEPEFTGFRRLVKGAFDRSMAALVLLLLAPLFLALVVAIRVTSRGPAFFRQTRIGRDGRNFTMLKFRSMYVDAEARLSGLRDHNQHGDGVLFKMRNDPRVTAVGRLLRKFSLDELPQLINVLTGSMSLVGPRPPLPREVACYEAHDRRRLLVKPGLTGLWQVSGRSDLAWDESVRLDLRYVENWSIASDLLIVWKTMFAVIRGTGAY
jgi:exopolysaccharide biosynthesis polyprenyl glycosylphosphotransferase